MRIVKNKEDLDVQGAIDIAPLIDCVFLLLIYFMVTASLVKKEADIAFALPASVSQTEPVNLPVEVIIEIDSAGTVQVEGLKYDVSDRMLNELVVHLQGLQQIAASQSSIFTVNLLPGGDVLHERIIEVMDACAAAGVKNLTFSKSI
jgi:biopolymer transport protein ExbD